MKRTTSARRLAASALGAISVVALFTACGGTSKPPGADAGATGGTVGSGGGGGGGGSGEAGSGGAALGGAGGRSGGTGGVTGTGGGLAGRGGSGGTAGRAGSGGNGGTGGGSVGSGGAGGACTGCGLGRLCCGGACINPANDPTNCGRCGMRCPAPTTFCGGGSCQASPCGRDGGACAGGESCCGSACCTSGQLCCDPQGPISAQPTCFTPTLAQPTCSPGCAPLCISDRNLKRDLVPVDSAEVLARVAALPISSWSYLDQPSSVRHLGPMAQDFHAQFGLGDSDRTYNSVDAHGVALAAIQALDRLVRHQEAEIKALQRRNDALARRLEAIEAASRPAAE